MKITLNEFEFIAAVRAVRPQNFSIEGLRALFAHLEEVEEDSGEEMELDVIALCCNWDEYPDAECAAADYGREFDSEEEAFEFFSENSTVIDFDGGIIIENF
jgi:hypothetical protein